MSKKYLQYLAALSTLTLLFPLGALARDKSEHSLNFSNPVQVGNTQLAPGKYEVEWQGDGPTVQVSFMQYGKTVTTTPGTLKTNDEQVKQDEFLTNGSGGKTPVLTEIDFGHQREALVFNQNSSGM